MRSAGEFSTRTCGERSSRQGAVVPSGRRVFLEWLLVALLALGLLLAYISFARVADPEVPATREVLVESGDTLWSLARANPVPGLSTSQTATLIGTLNEVDPRSLHAGVRILVPAVDADTVTEIALHE